ncbi:hypothetical protein ADN00_03765 [Ornatilinea apprima]|uniref:Asparagine synthetase domain-containing protein n=1 Tax=Ornatilinea apprima TaxID=1134406 RepID=A0A0N8GNT8_9CHLR|nr:ATP-dependent sacrificial sulfur transferase LarE [Ornatilinea apprima]KPL79018.1 hypothetical protein ADN00_03765 [Ornatilinea apprima]
MDEALRAKWDALQRWLGGFARPLVAFSGGVDSALLAFAARQAHGDQMLAVTVKSPLHTSQEIQRATAFAVAYGIPQRLIELNEMEREDFTHNAADRCYQCKALRFTEIVKLAASEGFDVVLEGSNADDAFDYRPGARAAKELDVRSPLAELNFTKAEIRAAAQTFNLPVWNLPSSPCLATRFAYGFPITPEGLIRVEKAESFLRELGLDNLRARVLNQQSLKIETAPDQFLTVLQKREQILAYFDSLGFANVSLDLKGYRRGSMNEDFDDQNCLP